MLIGLDIGGANLKASNGEDHSVSHRFAIWKEPRRLARELASLLAPWPDCTELAVTMTAELADCFATKAEGVEHILGAVEEVAAGRTVHVWQTGGEFVTVPEAREFPRLVAAANWHALATWAGRMAPAGSALLLDIGSTTTDIIPLQDGLPDPVGRTDLERLQSSELLYLGVRRTPLCALAPSIPFRDASCPVAAELFATTLDVFLLTGDIPADKSDHNTADGRPATCEAAHTRIAHMLCCDSTEIALSESKEIARQYAAIIRERIATSLRTVLQRMSTPIQTLLLCGEGEWLARVVWEESSPAPDVETLSLTSLLGTRHSQAACAYALARLARERS